ncbi:MAG TPA: hypothetical protein VGK26_11675 [Thermoanaerobaculia bacterium]|jgi:hypothetical protein
MRAADAVLRELRAKGLLLQQDKALPSVVGIVTGESLRGSWWSHPKGRLIFTVLSELADRPDVLFTKLLSGKVTLVHRRLWPALAAVGAAREPWQLRGLSPAARRLLARVDRGGAGVRASGAAAKELEARLLVVARQVHTESGRHETALQDWGEWSAAARCRPLRSAASARRTLERAAARLGAPPEALPWNARSSSSLSRSRGTRSPTRQQQRDP